MRHIAARLFAFVSLIVAGAVTAGEGWTRYSAPDYGFSMLMPADAEIREREWPDGWGGLYGEHQGVELYALARLGDGSSSKEIEKFGVKLTGIAEEHWKLIDEGEESAGWKWYRAVEARAGDRVVFGGYGVGEKGSYLLLLATTREDFKAYRSDYQHWYESVRLE